MKSQTKRVAAILATFAMVFLPTIGTAETDKVIETYRIDCRRLPGDAAVHGHQNNLSDTMTLRVGNQMRNFSRTNHANLFAPRTPWATGSAESKSLNLSKSHDYCHPW